MLEDRTLKRAIHAKVETAIDEPKRSDVESILDMAKTEIFIPDHRFDVDETSVNCMNGELHWIGGEWILKPHCRENYRTTQIPISHDQAETAPRFEQFLFEIFQNDADSDEKQMLVCEAIGYTLLSTARYEKFFILIGPGANGKSVLLEILAELVGFQNVCGVQPAEFQNKFQRAHLHRKLANLVTELRVGAQINDAELKAITSGELTTVEHKNKALFDIRPFSTCWFASNFLPNTRDFSDALFRRGIVIPFNRTFKEREQDRNLKDKLKTEFPGILNLGLDGIANVFDRGYFSETESCIEAKKQWRLEADQAAEFANEKCRFDTGLCIESGKLYEAYKQWSEDAGIKKNLNRKNFTQRMIRLGAEPGKGTAGTRMIYGVDLADSGASGA